MIDRAIILRKFRISAHMNSCMAGIFTSFKYIVSERETLTCLLSSLAPICAILRDPLIAAI